MVAVHKRLLLAASISGVALCLVVYLAKTGWLTCEMYKDLGYLRWTHGSGVFEPQYTYAFLRDPRFRNRLIGRPIESLKPLFPDLHSGASYSPDSYRAKNISYSLGRYTGLRVEHYWVSGSQQEFGLCVLVVGGKISDFIFLKG